MTIHSRPVTTQPPADAAPTFDVRDLMCGVDRAQIVLDAQVYILRITRVGKLILTK